LHWNFVNITSPVIFDRFSCREQRTVELHAPEGLALNQQTRSIQALRRQTVGLRIATCSSLHRATAPISSRNPITDVPPIVSLICPTILPESILDSSQQGQAASSLLSGNSLSSMSLSDLGPFSSRNELVEHVRLYARTHGFVATIKRSEPARSVYLHCDRSGIYRNRSGDSVRSDVPSRSTKLVDCPFLVHGSKQKDGSWHLVLKEGAHDHELETDLVGHPYARRLTPQQQARVSEMNDVGSQPKTILSALHLDNPDTLVIARTVYDARAKQRRLDLKERSPIQALLDKAREENFFTSITLDDEGHITRLFFAHPKSIELLQTYSKVLLMDCTYKTNRFRMPLLNIVGMTATNSTFFGAFAFLQKETEADYHWALQNLREVMPGVPPPGAIVTDRDLALMNAISTSFPAPTRNILCIWHINKNILARCKRNLTKGEGRLLKGVERSHNC